MASKFTTTITANTTQHDNAIKKSAQEVYKYQKSVDSAKSVIGNMAKKIPQLVAAVGVSVSAMAAFKKMINQTQTATDTWGRSTSSINSTLNVLANRLSGVGFGDFIDNLKEASRAARETYDALDKLGTMTIFQDRATADYNYKRAQYEQTIKTSKNPQLVKQAQKDLEVLDREYQAGQEALAQQSILTYQKMMRQKFAEGGVKVTDGFIEKYLGSLKGYEQAMDEYVKLYERIYGKNNVGGLAAFITDPNSGVSYWDTTGVPKNIMQRYEALKIVTQVGDDELRKANQHYINARNIQTKLVQDETNKLRMNEKANTRINKIETKEETETPQTVDEAKNALTELNSELDELQRKLTNVRYEVLTNDNPTTLQYLQEQSYSLSEQIRKKKEEIKTLEDNIDFALNGSPVDEYAVNSLTYLEELLEEHKKKLQEAINQDAIDMIGVYMSMIKNDEGKIKQKKIDLGLIEPDEIEKTVYSLNDAYSAINSLYSSINSLGSLLGDVFDNEEISEFFEQMDKGLRVVNALYSVFESFNKVMEIFNGLKAASNVLTKENTVATTANAAAEGADASAKANNAIAGATKSGAVLPFPYNLIAIAGGIAAVMGALALMGNYAQGGIIGGSTTVGDHQLAHVNAGEMILNQREQTRLWHMVNGVGVNSNNINGNVSFRISGSDLVGVLNNYETKNRRVR